MYIGTAPWLFSPALDTPRPIERTDISIPALLENFESRKGGDLGRSNCPCINPWDSEVLGTGKGACPLQRNADGSCYQRSYGSVGCQAYDERATSECLGDNPPRWCSTRFCYVDPKNCKSTQSGPSTFFPNVRVRSATGESPLTYSSETCTTHPPTLSHESILMPAPIDLVTNPPLSVMALHPWSRPVQAQVATEGDTLAYW